MSELNRIIELLRQLEPNALILQLVQFLVWVILIFVLSWIARKIINRTITDNTLRYRARKMIRFTSYVLIFLLIIITFIGQVQYFTLAIGLLGAGVAFALQEVILSIAGWVAINSARIYKPGDRIEVNDIKGDVIAIGITRTTLMEIGEWVRGDNYNGRIVQIGNSSVFKHPVHNYSTDFPFVWDEIQLPVKYGSDIETTSQLILDAANRNLSDYVTYAGQHWNQMLRKYLIENANVNPALSFVLTDNYIEFTLRYVVDYKKRRSTKHKLFGDILESIRESGDKVAISSASFEVSGLPKIRVTLDKNGENH